MTIPDINILFEKVGRLRIEWGEKRQQYIKAACNYDFETADRYSVELLSLCALIDKIETQIVEHPLYNKRQTYLYAHDIRTNFIN